MDGQFHTETTHQAHDVRFDAGRVRHETEARRETKPAVQSVEYGSGWYHEVEIAKTRADARHV